MSTKPSRRGGQVMWKTQHMMLRRADADAEAETHQACASRHYSLLTKGNFYFPMCDELMSRMIERAFAME